MSQSSIFQVGLVDRLRGQYPSVDVYAIADRLRDWAKRKAIANPSGLLVDQVSKAARQKTLPVGAASEVARAGQTDDLQRYAQFHAELYRDIVEKRLTLAQIADRLEVARKEGYPRLNQLVANVTRAIAHGWDPAEVPSC